ncbi:MAG: VanZ family protein [Anaerotruncus sp.]|nr:MAG: VanZ family protein [Anaerotruncus sp.]
MCFFSVCIELVQFIIGLLIGYNYRCVDIDDVILNSLGGIIILLVFERIIKRVKKTQKQKNKVRIKKGKPWGCTP